ncbi:MAG: hypothetical protein LBK83_06135 [Treponema sp.]|nr:hypothetical protein [Treponema sp.]
MPCWKNWLNKVKLLPASADVDRLAALYVAEGAVPAGYPEDPRILHRSALDISPRL